MLKSSKHLRIFQSEFYKSKMVLIKHQIFNKNLIKLNRNQKILKIKKTNKKKGPNQRKRLANNKY